MKSLYGAVGPQLLPEETSIRLEGGRATQWIKHGDSGVRNQGPCRRRVRRGSL